MALVARMPRHAYLDFSVPGLQCPASRCGDLRTSCSRLTLAMCALCSHRVEEGAADARQQRRAR